MFVTHTEIKMIHAGLVNDVIERLKSTYDAYVFVLIAYMSLFINYLLINYSVMFVWV